MQVTGTFIKKLPIVEGTSSHGYWVRCGFEIMTLGTYPKMVAFEVFGENRVKALDLLASGQIICVDFTAESREVGDKVFTSLRCARIRSFTNDIQMLDDQSTQTDELPY